MVRITVIEKNGVRLNKPITSTAINFPEARRLAKVNGWHGSMTDGYATIPLQQQ